MEAAVERLCHTCRRHPCRQPHGHLWWQCDDQWVYGSLEWRPGGCRVAFDRLGRGIPQEVARSVSLLFCPGLSLINSPTYSLLGLQSSAVLGKGFFAATADGFGCRCSLCCNVASHMTNVEGLSRLTQDTASHMVFCNASRRV